MDYSVNDLVVLAHQFTCKVQPDDDKSTPFCIDVHFGTLEAMREAATRHVSVLVGQKIKAAARNPGRAPYPVRKYDANDETTIFSVNASGELFRSLEDEYAENPTDFVANTIERLNLLNDEASIRAAVAAMQAQLAALAPQAPRVQPDVAPQAPRPAPQAPRQAPNGAPQAPQPTRRGVRR